MFSEEIECLPLYSYPDTGPYYIDSEVCNKLPTLLGILPFQSKGFDNYYKLCKLCADAIHHFHST